MAKAAKAKKAKTVKVWHIFRFEQRFEMSDKTTTCRKGPLIFVREYVGVGSDDESIGYKQQINILKQSPNRHVLRSVWDELREIAAIRSKRYRGYLLDESLKPMTDRRIAMLCGLELSACSNVLKELAAVGLIERVTLPAFDEDGDDAPPPTDAGKKKTTAKKKTTKKKTGSKKPADGGKNAVSSPAAEN